MNEREARSPRRGPLLVILTLGVAAAAAGGWWAWQQQRQAAVTRDLEAEAEDLAEALTTRVGSQIELTRRGVAHMDGPTTVLRDSWRAFVRGQGLDATWPGTAGFGVAVKVLGADRTAHVNALRGQGNFGYTLTPAGDREIYDPIIYEEPSDWRTQKDLGFDLRTDAPRWEAMQASLKLEGPQVSASFPLAPDGNGEAPLAFSVFVPWGLGLEGESKGWVFTTVTFSGMMGSLVDRDDVTVRLYDGSADAPASLVYERAATVAAPEGIVASVSRVVTLPGRTWTVNVSAPSP